MMQASDSYEIQHHTVYGPFIVQQCKLRFHKITLYTHTHTPNMQTCLHIIHHFDHD